MSSSGSTRTAAHRTRLVVLTVLAIVAAVVVAVIVGVFVNQPSAASAPSAIPETSGLSVPGTATRDTADMQSRQAPPPLGANGEAADGVTVFDDDDPAVAGLDPELLDAVRRAAADAADEGVTFYVNSGWRSADYQAQLLRDAIAEYGSAEEAARWVATPDTSPHVTGDAIDIGDSDATAWLSERGDEHGLCQIYANEPWHYELRPAAVEDDCPAMYPDPTHDPRMQK